MSVSISHGSKDRAFRSASNSDDGTVIPIGKLTRIVGEVGACDEVVDESQKFMRRIVINLIDIDDNWHSLLPSPPRSLKGGRGVAAVEMKNSGVGNEVTL